MSLGAADRICLSVTLPKERYNLDDGSQDNGNRARQSMRDNPSPNLFGRTISREGGVDMGIDAYDTGVICGVTDAKRDRAECWQHKTPSNPSTNSESAKCKDNPQDVVLDGRPSVPLGCHQSVTPYLLRRRGPEESRGKR